MTGEVEGPDPVIVQLDAQVAAEWQEAMTRFAFGDEFALQIAPEAPSAARSSAPVAAAA